MPGELHHVAIFVTDMNRAMHLFRDLLGLKVDWHLPRIEDPKLGETAGIPGMIAEIAYLSGRGRVAVELVRLIHPPLRQEPSGSAGSAHVGLSFIVNNLDALHTRLSEEGWEPFTPAVRMRAPDGGRVRIFCFSVEDSYTVELIEPEPSVVSPKKLGSSGETGILPVHE
ncbi:MAG: VOC family protein [Thermodesulfobacteriota bacterium]